MKRMLILVLTALIILSGFSCIAETNREFSVAWICEVLNESNNLYTKNWKAALEEADTADDSFSITNIDIFDCQNDVNTQIATIENCVSSGKYDVLVINPVDTIGVVPAYEEAYNADVKIVDIGGAETDAKTVYCIGLDEHSQGTNMKNYLADYLDKNPEIKLNMCLMEGLPETIRCLPRLQYIREELAVEYADRINILAESWGLWNTEKAASIAEDWMQAYPDLNFIACADDTMAVGVLNAIVAAGRGDDIKVIGFNGDDGVLSFISSGEMLATSGNYLGMMAKEYAAVTLQCMLGTWDESVKEYSLGTKVLQIVDASNVEQFAAEKYTKTE